MEQPAEHDFPVTVSPARPASRPRVATLLLIASIATFAVSLTQTAYYLDGNKAGQPLEGLMLLLVGWIYVLDGNPAWLANVGLLLTWIFMRSRRFRWAATVVGMLSLGLSLNFLRTYQIMCDEGGHMSTITGHGAAYWLWVASIGLAILGCAASRRKIGTNATDRGTPRVT